MDTPSDSSIPEPRRPSYERGLAEGPAGAPERREAISPHLRPRRGFRVLSLLGWGGMVICMGIIVFESLLLLVQGVALSDYYDTTGGIQERYHSFEERGSKKVAIIRVKGVIMDGDGFVKRQIDRVRQDDKVRAVVLRIDSPGGTVTGSDFLFHHLKKLREEKKLPIVVSMGGVAASGGYYIAMSVGHEQETIFAEPTTTTGSIGVIIPHYDISGLMEDWNIKDDSIASHPRKQLLSMTRPMSPEDKEILDNYLTDSFNRFKKIIKSGRAEFEKNEESLVELATGEIFTANQAVENGLVDRIGFIEEAIERAIQLAKLDNEDVRVVRYNKPAGLIDIFASGSTEASSMNPKTLFEFSTPRAYYLCTSLPPLMTSHGL